MANEQEEECFPPAEFILSTIQQAEHSEGNTAKNVGNDFVAESSHRKAVDCRNCLRNVGGLLCVRCITEKDSLLDKQRTIVGLRRQRAALLDIYNQKWKSSKHVGDQFSTAVNAKTEVEYNLNRWETFVRLKRAIITRHSEQLKRLQDERRRRLEVTDRLRSSIDLLTKKSTDAMTTIPAASLDRRRRDLAKIRQRFVVDLLGNVFPLDAVSSGVGSSTGASSLDGFEVTTDLQDILADAALTTFLHDRWIFTGNSPDVQYRLVCNCLAPDHGDYTLLRGWLFNDMAATVPSGSGVTAADVVVYSPPMTTSDSVVSNRGALGTLSALAYTAQLVNVISRILDVRLPFSLTFSDFFVDKLREAEFDTAVVKLNANVAYLCSSQRMDHDCVCFERPFWSLCNLSKNIKELGRQCYFIVDARVARGFANAEKDITWMERAQVTVVESTDDWENISEQIPEWTGAASSPPTLSQLWTSATTSVANLFKIHN